MTNTMNERRTALADLMEIAGDDRAEIAELIINYCGQEIIDDDLARILAIITGESDQDMAEITATLELIDEIDPDFAAYLAGAAELCADHYSDPENCADEH